MIIFLYVIGSINADPTLQASGDLRTSSVNRLSEETRPWMLAITDDSSSRVAQPAPLRDVPGDQPHREIL